MLGVLARTVHDIWNRAVGPQLMTMIPSSKAVRRVFLAFGFDVLGYDVAHHKIDLGDGGTIEFAGLKDQRRLDGDYEGVIIPQGIFEQFDGKRGFQWKQDLLSQREKEVWNRWEAGKWTCFLVRQIVDEIVGSMYMPSTPIRNTDLCKWALNALDVHRAPTPTLPHASATDSEFTQFVREYGTSATLFYLRDRSEFRTLVRANDLVVGFEASQTLFFLPFYSTNKTNDDATRMLTMLVKGIHDYRQKRIVEMPDWVHELRFEREIVLDGELDSLRQQIAKLEAEQGVLRQYRAILTTSGDLLKDKLIEIMKNFFGFKVDPIDDRREDFKLLNDDESVFAVVESKGVKSGIKREHINQVDSHRERNGLDSTVPGILLINNEMSVEGIEARCKTSVPSEHVVHAQRFNCLVVRTIDLLLFMKMLENDADRGDKIRQLVSAGGGWLRAEGKEYQLKIK